ncbi:MAG: hypothetical protein HUU20_09480 [Pirellulales bacterium]|nr:hypothetical protein [Pirellulales bacterium]
MDPTRRQVLAVGIGSLFGPLLRSPRASAEQPAKGGSEPNKPTARETEAGEIVTDMVVDGKPVQLSPTAAYPRRPDERWQEPVLIDGSDGQPWLFYRSNVRRFLYYHRWLGDGWGPRYDGRGFYFVDPDSTNVILENYLPIRTFQARCGSENSVEVTLHSEVWGVPETRVQSIPRPDPAMFLKAGSLFLDTSFVAETRNLTRHCELPVKHPANPVFTPSDRPDLPDQMGVMNHGTVLRDEKGCFRMWYSGYERVGQGPTPPGRNWQDYMHVCYAQSDDGIHWRRPELGLLSYAGSKRNNLLPLYLTPVVVEDPVEGDPSRRFKAPQQVGVYNYPLRSHLQVSPDAVHWRTLVGRREYPGTRPWWFEFNCCFRDNEESDPARRWKAYGYFATSPKRRTCGLATSPDCLTWTGYPENPVIDPCQGKKEHVHDLVVWKEQGLYVGLVQVRDSDHHYEYELVFSHDGIHFSRVQDGLALLPLGGPQDWDCDLMTAASAPVFVGDETWFYYGAKQKIEKLSDSGDPYAWSLVTTSAGLATMTRGRYAGFAVKDGHGQGTLRTVPFSLPAGPLRLRLNAACTAEDTLRVAVIDANSGKFLRGFDDCEPLVGNGIALPVIWREPAPPPGLAQAALVFQLTGKARLYGLQFS